MITLETATEISARRTSALAGIGLFGRLCRFPDLLDHPVAVALFNDPLDMEEDMLLVRSHDEVRRTAVAIFAAGAVLANPGVFSPLALKTISELDPTRSRYFVEWAAFTVVFLLPLTVAIAIAMLIVAREWAERVLGHARDWLVLHARTIGAAIVILLAASLLRSRIAGLTS
jgi:hypothetical protein